MSDLPLPLDAPTMPQSFLLSTPRAGSTLLRYIIDTHSKIASPGELGLGILSYRLFVLVQRTLAKLGPEDEAVATGRAGAAALLGSVMEAYTRGKGKEQWCDKTPGNVEYAGVLSRVFPEAKFICLHRFALDTVHSSVEVSRHGYMDDLKDYVVANPGNLVAAMVDSWVDKTRSMVAFEEANPERCFRIRYEDVVLNSRQALPPMFEFLGVEWEDKLLDRVFSTQHDQGAGDPKVHFTGAIDPSYIGKGKNIHYEVIPEPQLERMNDLLATLGYPTVEEDWNDTPLPFTAGEAGGADAAADGDDETGQAESGDDDQPSSAREVFEGHVPAMMEQNAEELKALDATFQFVIPDAETSSWIVDLSGDEPRVEAGETEADCTATMQEEVLLAIARRQVNAFSAFSEGKIQLQGQLELAYKVGLFL